MYLFSNHLHVCVNSLGGKRVSPEDQVLIVHAGHLRHDHIHQEVFGLACHKQDTQEGLGNLILQVRREWRHRGGGTEDGRDGVGDGRWFEAREFDKLTLSWARRKEYLSYTCSAKQVALPQNYLVQLQTT